MELSISNNIVINQPNDAILEFCDKELTIDNPTYLIAQKLGRYTHNIPKKMKLYTEKKGCVVLPFGVLQNIWNLCKGAKWETHFPTKRIVEYSGVDLYDYQAKAVQKMVCAKNGVLQAPCGSGKTRMGLAIISILKGKALWLTHTHQLLEQSLNSAKNLFKTANFGTITEGKVNIGETITFATIQTLSKIDLSTIKNEFDVVIVDECHRCVGTPTQVKMFYKVVSNLNARFKFGLTATPNRSDNLQKTMFTLLGGVVHKIEKNAVGTKIIKAEYNPINIDLEYNVYDYVDYDGTFQYTKLINMLAENEQRNKIILNNIIANKGRVQIVLTARREQAKWFYDNLAGHNALLVLGGMKNDFSAFKKYDIIVATEQLAKEGLDYQELDCLHLITPIKNKGMIEQCVGRVQRNVAGKRTPIVYDYVDVNIQYCVNASKIKQKICRR